MIDEIDWVMMVGAVNGVGIAKGVAKGVAKVVNRVWIAKVMNRVWIVKVVEVKVGTLDQIL